MKKKRILIILFAMILAFAIAGCDDKNKVDKEVSGDVSENETVTENKNATEEKQKTDNKKDNTTTNTETNKNNTTTNKNESTSNKNETTTKPSTGSNNNTTKPNTGSTGNTGSTNNSGNTGSTTNNNTNSGTTTQPSTPVHEHNWTEVTEDEIHYYAWRTLCGKCGLDMTDMSDEELTIHVTFECQSRYSTKYIEVDFVTENVVKTPVVTGYKCECGATKNK